MQPTLYLVQATIGNPPREYTHYTCRERHNAERLATILASKRPEVQPISVVEWQPNDEEARRITRYADASQGPK